MSVLVVAISTARPAATLARDFQHAAKGKVDILRISEFLQRVGIGGELQPSVVIQVRENGTRASGTVTAASVQAADTITICGVVLTAHASTQNATTFALGISDTLTGDNIVTCINANTTLNTLVTAVNAAGVVTIYANNYDKSGNGFTLATSNTGRLAKSGTSLSGGAVDTGARTHTF